MKFHNSLMSACEVPETAPWTVLAAQGSRFSTFDSSRVLPLKASCLFAGFHEHMSEVTNMNTAKILCTFAFDPPPYVASALRLLLL